MSQAASYETSAVVRGALLLSACGMCVVLGTYSVLAALLDRRRRKPPPFRP